MGTARVAVVTGASSGIGEATARELARRGWRCVLLARRADRLQTLAEELGGEWEACDVRERPQVDEVAARVLERHPAIALLVNNAGVPGRGTFVSTSPETVERVTETNYFGGVWCTRAFYPGLRAAAGEGRAHVVNVISVAGTIAFAPAGPYAAAKHAQLAFSRSLAATLRSEGIRVHTILPGFVETEGFKPRTTLQSALMRRFVIDSEDVARAIVRAVERGKHEVTVPWFPYRLVSLFQAAFPGLLARMVGRYGYRPGVHD
ncbi:MAG TPA: SDR family NAD(P)-dependent oxidoreductase [Gaiellaceae bacterium]|nr:SDR family NAD(P)-dependent oxidoreductase [Gaiellaceae bacterium]